MGVKMRQIVEREICTAVVKALLKARYEIEVDNGGDKPELPYSRNREAILKAMFLTDDEYLHVQKRSGQPSTFGWVHLVYGNDGWDVISDYTTNLEPIIGANTSVEKIVKKYED